jgi:hypothetical protein
MGDCDLALVFMCGLDIGTTKSSGIVEIREESEKATEGTAHPVPIVVLQDDNKSTQQSFPWVHRGEVDTTILPLGTPWRFYNHTMQPALYIYLSDGEFSDPGSTTWLSSNLFLTGPGHFPSISPFPIGLPRWSSGTVALQ